MTFEELGLSDPLLRAIAEAGYTSPTPIQAQAIPHLLMGRDIIGIAQTGTGKTAGFTLPMIEALSTGRARARMPRSLILEPTRELAAQVAENFETYGKNHKLSMALLIGGVSFSDQEDKLDRGVDVLIATPGRLLDHFERGKVLLADIRILVVDEADRMLDMGFIPDVERIIKLLPAIRQTAMFSATMPKEIQRLTEAYMMSPRTVQVAPQASAAETVKQNLVMVNGDFKAKREVLRKLIRSENVRNAIVFCNRKRDVATLEKSLRTHGFNAAGLHGDMHQTARMETLEKFRKGEITILVASDVAARGIDITDMSHVFNFDVPMHSDDYIHRIGRTGRAGREGRALMIATKSDAKYLDAIERMLGKPIPRLEDEAALDAAAAAAVSEEGTGEPPVEDGGEDKPARRGRGSRGGSRSASRTSRGESRRGRGRRRSADDEAETEREETVEASTSEEEAGVEGNSPGDDNLGDDNLGDDNPGEDGRDEAAEKESSSARSRHARERRARSGRDGDKGGSDSSRRDEGQRRRRRDRDDDDDGVTGMGDHTPAFLLR